MESVAPIKALLKYVKPKYMSYEAFGIEMGISDKDMPEFIKTCERLESSK